MGFGHSPENKVFGILARKRWFHGLDVYGLSAAARSLKNAIKTLLVRPYRAIPIAYIINPLNFFVNGFSGIIYLCRAFRQYLCALSAFGAKIYFTAVKFFKIFFVRRRYLAADFHFAAIG